MVSSRALTALAGVGLSLAVSLGAYFLFDTLLLFLFVPFVPILLSRSDSAEGRVRECPVCGFQTAESYEFCPHHGIKLE